MAFKFEVRTEGTGTKIATLSNPHDRRKVENNANDMAQRIEEKYGLKCIVTEIS